LSNIIGSLIKQICTGSDEAFDELDTFFKKYNPKDGHPLTPSNEELGKLLMRLSRHFDCVMVIIDGLDECSLADERSATLQLLSKICAPEHGNIRAVFTSRDEIDIRSQLSECKNIPIAARGTDLELFVAAGIESRISNKTLRLKDLSLKETIIDGIVSKANGM